MEKKKVLYVDDSIFDRTILAKILTDLDVDHHGTKTPEEFLGCIKEYNPDLCLVDLNISRTNDGRVLIKAIRNILGNKLPIIVISALKESHEIADNIRNGANDFVCKPVDKSLLTTKISNYLHSDAISSNILPLFKVPDNEDKHCHIDFQCRVVNIGEKGIEFLAKFTVKENIKIKVQDRIIKEMLGVEEALELTVTKSWQDEATKRNYFYGEFPELTSMQKQKVRRYISDYISKA